MMVRSKLLLLLILLFIFSSAAFTEVALPVAQEGAPLYSNLGDEESLLAVCEAMKMAGMNEEAVDAVCDWIRDYNQIQKTNPVYEIVAGFYPMTDGYVDYGDADTYVEFNWQRWKVAQLNYYDVLCRSTAFYLLRDQMSIEERIPAEKWERNGFMETDFDAFYGVEEDDYVIPNPAVSSLTEDDIAAYATLFAPVPDNGENTEQAIADSMNRAFGESGVHFPQGRAKMIMVCYPAERQLAVRHAAILIEMDSGYLLFEKYGPDYPYQAALFATINEISTYLKDSIAAEYARYNLAAPDAVAVLCNGQLI